MDILDIYTNDGKGMENKVIESIKEVNDKLKDENNGKERTKLLYEMMLRGLYLSQCPDYKP